MPTLLIRDVPKRIDDWIADQSHSRRTSKKDFVLEVLRGAVEAQEELPLFDGIESPPPAVNRSIGLPFTFIDLFAGIGGMRLGLERVGGRCIFSSEWDKFAQKTYAAWFDELPHGDVREIDTGSMPDHDLLAAGFPCQPFSLAGVSKKKSLGMAHGFRDVAQGTLFFHLASIIEAKRPPVILLENVKNLRSHDGGKTWAVIEGTLRDLNYVIHHRIIDAAHWVPQHRERIFIVGFDQSVFGSAGPDFNFPELPKKRAPRFRDILDPNVSSRYVLTDHLWSYLKRYAAKHKAKGNGFGFGMTDLDGVSRTLSARYHKDGSEILIPRGSGKNPRRLSPREAARLMGFPDELPIVVSDTQAYRQFGNAVVPPVVEAIGSKIAQSLAESLADRSTGCLFKKSSSRRTSAGRPARRS